MQNFRIKIYEKLHLVGLFIQVESILKSWIEVPDNTIIKFFLKFVLSNEKDGTQDDILRDKGEWTDECDSESGEISEEYSG